MGGENCRERRGSRHQDFGILANAIRKGVGGGKERYVRGQGDRHLTADLFEKRATVHERVDVRGFKARVTVATQMVGAQGVDGNEDNRRRSSGSRSHSLRARRCHSRRPNQQGGQEENRQQSRASRQAHIGMILDHRHGRKVELWMTINGDEQGVGNADRREDRARVMHANDVRSIQNCSDHRGCVAHREERNALLVRFAAGF